MRPEKAKVGESRGDSHTWYLEEATGTLGGGAH